MFRMLAAVLNHFHIRSLSCFAGELEQKRRAQSFLTGQEPKAGKVVSRVNSIHSLLH